MDWLQGFEKTFEKLAMRTWHSGPFWVAVFLLWLCFCQSARALEPERCPSWSTCADSPTTTAAPAAPRTEPGATDEAPAPIDERDIAAWDHFEISMGFIAGQRDFSAHTYDGAFRLDPRVFDGAPFGDTEAYGLRYDLRLVVWYVRMTAGVDIPFASYDVEGTRLNIDGQDALVTGMKSWAFHFGIGGEYPIGPVAPFIDVLGGLSFAKPTIAIGPEEVELRGQTFGFTVRGGLRLHVRKWFFASLSGEVGLVGDVRWGTELSVGFAIM